MDFPVRMVIELANEDELKTINEGFQLLRDAADNLDVSTKGTLGKLLDGAQLRQVDSHKEARVLINGQPIAIGTKEEMLDRFKTECSMHQTSNVVIQEWIDGDYKQVGARRVQKVR